MYVLLSLLVAVPPVTEKLTTTSKGREALEGTMFTIIGRVISTSSPTTSPGNGCKNMKSIAETIEQECVDDQKRYRYIIPSKGLYINLKLPSTMPTLSVRNAFSYHLYKKLL